MTTKLGATVPAVPLSCYLVRFSVWVPMIAALAMMYSGTLIALLIRETPPSTASEPLRIWRSRLERLWAGIGDATSMKGYFNDRFYHRQTCSYCDNHTHLPDSRHHLVLVEGKLLSDRAIINENSRPPNPTIKIAAAESPWRSHPPVLQPNPCPLSSPCDAQRKKPSDLWIPLTAPSAPPELFANPSHLWRVILYVSPQTVED